MSGPRVLPKLGPPVVLEQVVVRFPDAEAPALAGVGFRIDEGEIVALSGRAMAGKSVLAEAILGLHPLAGGRILCKGTDIRQIPVDDLRRTLSVAHQKPEFLYGTIAQNLGFATPGVGEDAIWRAIEEAGVADLVRGLPEGLGTRLTAETLAELPGQLLQGLSLSRAFLRPGPVFIFDQPTAGLEPSRAECVRRAIAARRNACAVLWITNTRKDLENADRFLVLDRGRLILSERGRTGRDKAEKLLQMKELDVAA